MMIPVEGHPNLFRDEKSGAIINCDNISYEQYITSKNKRLSQRKEIDELKYELSEIKKLLKEIINESKRN